MKNRVNLGLVGVVVLLAAVAGILFWQNGNLASAERCAAGRSCQTTVSGDGLKLNVVSVDQADIFFNIQAEYPQISGADPAFNAKIAATVNGLIDKFKTEAKDDFAARNATRPVGQASLSNPDEPFDFIAAWTPAQFGPRYASFMVDIYYFSGGAHGTDQVFAFNYDLQNQKEITISDFMGSPANLDKLAKLSRDQVISQLQANGLQANDSLTQMTNDGTKAVPDNYRNFNFGYGKFTVYFEQYQVAPGSAGTVTLNFYKSDLDQAGIATSYLN